MKLLSEDVWCTIVLFLDIFDVSAEFVVVGKPLLWIWVETPGDKAVGPHRYIFGEDRRRGGSLLKLIEQRGQ